MQKTYSSLVLKGKVFQSHSVTRENRVETPNYLNFTSY